MRFPWSQRPSAEEEERDLEERDYRIETTFRDRCAQAWARVVETLPWTSSADEDAEREGENEEKQPRQWRRPLLIAGAALLVIGLAAALIVPRFVRRLQERSLRQAREYVRVQDYRRAQLTLEQAVQVNPAFLQARRELAKFYEEAGSSRSLPAWQALVDLNPNDPADRLSLAHCALIFGDLDAAKNALNGVRPSDRDAAEYHRLLAALDLRRGDQAGMVAELAILTKLEPNDARTQLNRAMIEVTSGSVEQAAEGRRELLRLAQGDQVRIRATLELMGLAVRQNSETAYTRLGDELLPPRRDIFRPVLGQQPHGLLDLVEFMQGQPDPNADDAALLAEWLIRQGYATNGLVWLETLKPAVQADRQVLAVRAEGLARIHDWTGVEACLRQNAWGRISDDALVLAFAARVQREHLRSDHSVGTWNDAVQATGASVDGLRVLLRLAGELGWPQEAEAVLWQLSKASPSDRSVWRALAASVSALRTTPELLQVYTAWRRADPTAPVPRGQSAWILSLLGKSQADDPSPKDPVFPALAASRALDLINANKPRAAADLLKEVPVTAARDPRVALARALAFSSLGQRAESEAQLAIATHSPLLPEERALYNRAHSANGG